jgi:nitroreductase
MVKVRARPYSRSSGLAGTFRLRRGCQSTVLAKSDCSSRAKRWLLENPAKHSLDPAMRRLLEEPTYNLLHGAPVLVLILAWSPGQQAAEYWCLAAENFTLAARDEGLGTCWIGMIRPWLNLADIKAELKIPEKYQLVAPIVVGCPKGSQEPHERNPVEIHWIK